MVRFRLRHEVEYIPKLLVVVITQFFVSLEAVAFVEDGEHHAGGDHC